jgi:hypothetical protein
LTKQFSNLQINVVDEYFERLNIVGGGIVFAQKVDNVEHNFDAIGVPIGV